MSDAISYQKYISAELNISAEEQDVIAQIKGIAVQLSSRELIIETSSHDMASSKRKSLSGLSAGWEILHGRKSPPSQNSPKFSTEPLTIAKPQDTAILQRFDGEKISQQTTHTPSLDSSSVHSSSQLQTGTSSSILTHSLAGRNEHSISEGTSLLLESPDSLSDYMSAQSRGDASLSIISNSSSTLPNLPSSLPSIFLNVAEYTAGTLKNLVITANNVTQNVVDSTLAYAFSDFYSGIFDGDIFAPGDFMGLREQLDALETNASSSSDTASPVSQDPPELVLSDGEIDTSSSSKALISHSQYNSGGYYISLKIKKNSADIEKLQKIWHLLQRENKHAGNPYQFAYKALIDKKDIFLTLVVTPAKINPLSLLHPALTHGAAGDGALSAALAFYNPEVRIGSPSFSFPALSQKQLQYIANRIMSNRRSASSNDRNTYNIEIQDHSSSKIPTAMQIKGIADDQKVSSEEKKAKKLRNTGASGTVAGSSSLTTPNSDVSASSKTTSTPKTENDKAKTQDKKTERIHEKGAVKNILSGASHGLLGIVQFILSLLAFIVFPANLICKEITGSYLHSYPWEACKENIKEAGLNLFGGEKEI